MKPPTPPELIAALIADYASGMSLAKVARKHGVGDSTVSRYVTQAGVNRPLPTAKKCSVEECQSRHHARGYCRRHLARFERYGDPRAGRGRNERTEEHAERLEDLRWMAETGESLDGASERLGISIKTLDCFLRRNDPETLDALIARRPRDHNRYIWGESMTGLSGLSQQRRARKERRESVAA